MTAATLLERSLTKNMQRTMDFVEKAASNAVDAVKETPKETEGHIHAKGEPTVRQEGKKIPFSENPYRKTDVRDKAEQSQPKSTVTVKESIVEQIKAKQKHTSVEPKQVETGMLPQPKPSILAR